MIVLIPAYEPTPRLVRLIRELRLDGPKLSVLVVDDGSGPDYKDTFSAARAMGCDVIGYEHNRGKGHALKHGLAHIARQRPGCNVVTADADGQHLVDDILAVGDRLDELEETIILGSRDFSGAVPPRSRLGNAVTRFAFAISTGHRLSDTQTGLRGYPSSLLAWLQTIEGERFEYEINVLLHAVESGQDIQEHPIATVYLESNRSSHFRPLVDSAKVYAPLLRFSLSSLAAFLLDFALVLALQAATGNLLVAVVGARMCSSVFNFLMNRRLVFRARSEFRRSLVGYFSLAGVILAANYALMALLNGLLMIPLVVAKVSTEIVLFLASYLAQKRIVFVNRFAEPVGEKPTTPLDA